MQIRWISGLVFALLVARTAVGASHATPNFVAHAADPQVAEQVARTAEYFRKTLAVEWTGQELPNWASPCPIQVTVGSMGASGSTTFTFENGQVHSWDMRVRGTLERVLDSVVPHEVCHTIFASKFRRPLPRWADEGAATLVEHPSERLRQVDLLNRVFGRRQQMPLQTLFEIREYPQTPEDLYTLYAEGYSLAEFLVQRTGEEGKRVYLDFLADALSGGWEKAVQKHYDYNSVSALEQDWGKWVMAGSPNMPRDAQYALNGTRIPKSPPAKAKPQLASKDKSPAAKDVVIRSQSPNVMAPLALISRPLRKTTQTVALEAPAPGTGRASQSGGQPTQLRLPTANRESELAR